MERSDRIEPASQRKVRAISGWNVFQKEQLGESKSLEPSEYKQAIADISKKWRGYTDEQKEVYILQARYEQECRDRLSQTPLSLKGEGKTELEMQVGRSGCKKLSGKRLKVNYEQYQSHTLWEMPSQLGDGD